MNNMVFQLCVKSFSPVLSRHISVSAINNKNHSCKLLVVGGGSGGCTMAAKFARHFKNKDAVIVLEPSTAHYYQPLWTLVGAGVKKVADTRREEQSVLPQDVKWLKDHAESVEPDKNVVKTRCGDEINYEYIVIAVGVENDYKKVPGLWEALEDKSNPVSTIYAAEYCEKTYDHFKTFKGGDAIFTYPDTPIKCPGAPQKIAYLADSYFTMVSKRAQTNIIYNTCLPVIFGVPKYAKALLKVAERKHIDVNYETVLKEVRGDQREAVFLNKGKNTEYTTRYDFLHVTPPMRTPQFIRCNTDIVDQAGFLEVDKHTLQHVKYKNMYGIGDCTNTPNSKTAAAIAKQSYVLERNLLATMKAGTLDAKYDGYGACPLLTSYSTCILAEFIYGGVVHETLPFDQARESTIAYYMKKDLFPFLYWHLMLKGRYHGPEFIRRIVNPFGKN